MKKMPRMGKLSLLAWLCWPLSRRCCSRWCSSWRGPVLRPSWRLIVPRGLSGSRPVLLQWPQCMEPSVGLGIMFTSLSCDQYGKTFCSKLWSDFDLWIVHSVPTLTNFLTIDDYTDGANVLIKFIEYPFSITKQRSELKHSRAWCWTYDNNYRSHPETSKPKTHRPY